MRLIVLSASSEDHAGRSVSPESLWYFCDAGRRRVLCSGLVSLRHTRVQGTRRRANTGIGSQASPGVQSDMSHGSQTWSRPWPHVGIRTIEKQMEKAQCQLSSSSSAKDGMSRKQDPTL